MKSTQLLPNLWMNQPDKHTPSNHQMQQPIPDHAPEHNQSTLELIKSLPTDIQFYLVLKQEVNWKEKC
jgi:hypothetical protein